MELGAGVVERRNTLEHIIMLNPMVLLLHFSCLG